MRKMGYRITDTGPDDTATPDAPEQAPSGALPPIPLSPVDANGLPAGLGMSPAGG